ncbi:MAG: hypothetical protein ABIJ34_01910 [archaeon]
MNRLSGIIASMNYRELKAVEKDLYEGNIGKHIKHRLEKFEVKTFEKVCPTCGNILTQESEKYTLMFGPPDFKKRASFCGVDCLTFFVEKMNSKTNEVEQKHD